MPTSLLLVLVLLVLFVLLVLLVLLVVLVVLVVLVLLVLLLLQSTLPYASCSRSSPVGCRSSLAGSFTAVCKTTDHSTLDAARSTSASCANGLAPQRSS